MGSFWVPDRIDEPELMDQPGLPVAEVAEAYEVLRRVNQQLGNLAATRREFRRFVREEGRASTVLDVGSGSGDIALALQRLAPPERPGLVLALDRDPTAVRTAIQRGVRAIRGDALRLPMADQSVDLVIAIKFAHHFSGVGLARLLGEMTRVARRRVVILDIRRHRLAYWGFRLWSRLFTTNRLVRFDGPLSVLRGFTRDELRAEARAIGGFDWQVRTYLGFQVALVGRRRDPNSG